MKGVCVCVRVCAGRPSQLVARSDRALSAITAPGVSTTTISDNVVVAVATNTLVPLHLHLRGEAGGLARWGGARMRKEGFWEAFSDCDISTKLWHARQSRLYVHVVVMHSDVSMDDGWTLLPPTFITVIGASSLRAKVGV